MSAPMSEMDGLDFGSPPRHLLPSNCPEKIILAIDTCQDEQPSPFELESSTLDSFYMLKRAAWLFVQTKLQINKKHEFALVALTGTGAKWVLDFTSDPNRFIRVLETLRNGELEDVYDLNHVFKLAAQKLHFPDFYEHIPPPFIARLILFYNRSITKPLLSVNESVQMLLQRPLFFVDVIITHEPADVTNNVHEIVKLLETVDTKGLMYFFSVERDAKSLLDSVAKLMAHPLQRPPQQDTNYRIDESLTPSEAVDESEK